MTPATTLSLRDIIMSAWRSERDPERKATLLEWADAVGTIGMLWGRDRAALDNARSEMFASAPLVPAGGFGAARGVLRQPCEVLSFHAEVAARHPR